MSPTRRQFLSDAALAAATLAVLGPSARPACANPLIPQRKAGPNDRIRAAVIGVNGQGRSHIKQFAAQPDCEVAVICDVDRRLEGSVTKLAESVGQKPRFVTDLRRVFDDATIDVVSIATPNHWHTLAAIWAMQSGKDVYVEKPVSHNVLEGRRLVQIARKLGRIVQSGTQSRSNPGMRELIAFLHAGKIGTIRVARGLCYKPRASIGPRTQLAVPPEVDFNLWTGPAPLQPITRARFHYDWHWFWDFGNGDLGNQGIHEMDKARWGLNEKSLATRVVSLGGRVGYQDAGETANTQVCFFDYGSAQLIFEVRGLRTDPLLGAKVGNIWYCSEGYVVSTNYNSGVAFTPAGEVIQKFQGGGDHVANFLKAVRSRRPADLHADVEEGHVSSALCHLGNISYRLGRPLTADEAKQLSQGDLLGTNEDRIETLKRLAQHCEDNGVPLTDLRLGVTLEIDPQEEQIRGQPQAAALLSREYRQGFELPSLSTIAGPKAEAGR